MSANLVVDAADTTITAALLADLHDPRRGRAIVLADPDRNALTMLQNVLLGIGPDRDGHGWPTSIELARRWVGAWLRGRRIDDVVVAHADLLTDQQLTELVDLATGSTDIWLLARGSMRATDERLQRVTVDGFVAHWELLDERSGRPPQAFSGFPHVPLAGMLTFRRCCYELLSSTEFWIVDNLLHRCCIDTSRHLAEKDPAEIAAWQLVEPTLLRDYPVDAMITGLRGCQLAAFAHGLRLSFDAQALHARLKATPRLNRAAAALLGADPDPTCAAMLVAETLGASVEELSSLPLDALHPDGASIRLGDGTRTVPPAVTHILATHYQARIQASGRKAPTIPLFGLGDDFHPYPTRVIETQLRKTAIRHGIPRTRDMPIGPEQFSLTLLEPAEIDLG